MKTSRALLPGDVIAREVKGSGASVTYTVEGYTRRGKLKLRRPSGTLLTTWWHNVDSLPENYRLVKTGGG